MCITLPSLLKLVLLPSCRKHSLDQLIACLCARILILSAAAIFHLAFATEHVVHFAWSWVGGGGQETLFSAEQAKCWQKQVGINEKGPYFHDSALYKYLWLGFCTITIRCWLMS
jgi:hypothetical protein